MSKKDKKIYIVQIILGFILIIVGIIFLFITTNRLAYSSIMMGSSLSLIAILSVLIRRAIYTKSEQAALIKEEEINNKDERNVLIRHKSAYLTQKIMFWVLLGFAVFCSYYPNISFLVSVLSWGVFLLNSLAPFIFTIYYGDKL